MRKGKKKIADSVQADNFSISMNTKWNVPVQHETGGYSVQAEPLLQGVTQLQQQYK